MRSIIALALMTTPALAHPGAGLHLHEAGGFWIAAAAFTIGLGLTLRVVVQAVRAKA
ncbi:hypothetical protein [Sinisalibacter aestuarii]|uniref:Uncharacterized protein n=1 Tax=Sinisalibacter aestuarii TaxID=2949426 RepID=A0ABQ5LW83_9RHOB|nr:hypothetical protein [Sinisalibacter aestuarii]GKY89154.1 hypothetical protein STA1M1_30230 [Sinisalibacter aestuarii]